VRIAKVAFAPLLFERRTFLLERLEARSHPKELDPSAHFIPNHYIQKQAKAKVIILAEARNTRRQGHTRYHRDHLRDDLAHKL
jgi:hypothetical protein